MRKRIVIRGTVQGVGFRPFVYRLAQQHGIAGFVSNSTEGVVIEAEGPAWQAFLADLTASPPPLARIDEMKIDDLAPCGETTFVIEHSAAAQGEFALVPPDIATCPDCLRDLTEPGNPRCGYPFTNCTNCGPRYTIIQDIPYDRPATTMSVFPMCPRCQAEYDDPSDRRFHAQPNACPTCGPALSSTLEAVRKWLQTGEIVAIKGLGGYHLACDAASAAVARLRDRKRRGDKPFAVMVPDFAAVERYCIAGQAARRALENPRRPIVLLEKRPDAPLSPAVAPGNRQLGVMLPYTPLHHLLFQGAAFDALVMTSGNLSEEPIVSQESELPRLEPLADHFLTHNRSIQTRVDDSVVRLFRGIERVMRRSRGYAPQPIDLGLPLVPLVAAGGELKNTFCLTRDHYAILSQHIGDLENLETQEFFEETLGHMQRFFRVTPEAVVHDLHPRYLSTRFALTCGLPAIAVQHHHAHIVSCMAENHLHDNVIGVAFDGTGYGTDHKIWGGEVLVAGVSDFERRFHLRYIPLAGGDAAVREPWRVALAYLEDAFGRQTDILDLPMLWAIPPSRRRNVHSMIRTGLHAVDTSSAGRLFDAVAALLNLRLESTFEAQAAMELESIASGEAVPFDFDIDGTRIDLRQTIRDLVAGLRSGIQSGSLAARFHETLAAAIAECCLRIRSSDGLNRVCLSGGTFQNLRLLDSTVRRLESGGFHVYLHAEVPPNDGGLSLGQAVIGSCRLEGK